MQLPAKSIDDFKTERKGISPPLPTYLRVVPLLFYLTIIASIVLSGLFFLNYGEAKKSKEAAIQQNKKLQADIKSTAQMRKDLENEAKKASDVAAYVEASRPLQPLVVEIARSMQPEASLLDLRLVRDGDNPAQIKLNLRLGAETTKQLDLTLAKIGEQQFRAFAPQQNLAKGEISYQATLLWQDPSRSQPAPSPSTGP